MRESVDPQVAVILLNWNGWQDTLECIASLREQSYRNMSIIVVDNGSTDDSLQKLRNCMADVTMIAAGSNRGFSAGNNLGILQAIENNADYILLLNNDTIADPKMVEAFVTCAALYPDAGAFCAKIYYYDQPAVIWYAGSVSPTAWLAPMHVGQGEEDHGQYEQVTDVAGINGCAFFVRTAVVQQVGMMDERFFYKYEDVDWTMRIQTAGYQTLFVPQAKVWHKISRASGGLTPLWWYFDERSRLLWLSIHFSQLGFEAYYGRSLRSVVRDIRKALQTGGNMLKLWRNLADKWPIWIARLAGMFDYIRGYQGACPKWISELGKRSRGN